MAKIEEPLTLNAFAWTDDDTGEIIWALQTDFAGLSPEERPRDATPVIVEITPSREWVENKRKEHEFLGDLQDQMSKFTQDLSKLELNMRLKANG